MYLPPIPGSSIHTQQALDHINEWLAILTERELVADLHVSVHEGCRCMIWDPDDISLWAFTPWTERIDEPKQSSEYIIDVLLTCPAELVIEEFIGMLILFRHLEWTLSEPVTCARGVFTHAHHAPPVFMLLYRTDRPFDTSLDWPVLF